MLHVRHFRLTYIIFLKYRFKISVSENPSLKQNLFDISRNRNMKFKTNFWGFVVITNQKLRAISRTKFGIKYMKIGRHKKYLNVWMWMNFLRVDKNRKYKTKFEKDQKIALFASSKYFWNDVKFFHVKRKKLVNSISFSVREQSMSKCEIHKKSSRTIKNSSRFENNCAMMKVRFENYFFRLCYEQCEFQHLWRFPIHPMSFFCIIAVCIFL